MNNVKVAPSSDISGGLLRVTPKSPKPNSEISDAAGSGLVQWF